MSGLRKDERGSATLEFVFSVGLLLLPMLLVVVQIPFWAESLSMGRIAAQEGARVLTTADESLLTGYSVNSRLDAIENMVMDGGGAATVQLAASGSGSTTSGTGDCRARSGEYVRVTATVRTPAIAFGPLGEVGRLTWQTSHRERFDPYRSCPS